MAIRSFVKICLRTQLRNDNPVVLSQSGGQLEEMTMGDFYFSEKQVNSAAEDIMKLAIKFPQNDLVDDRWRELKEKINLATTIKVAIDTTTDISAFANPQIAIP